MRYVNRWMPLLFIGSFISSCTCHKEVEQVAKLPNAQRPAGFHISAPTVVLPTAQGLRLGQPTPPQIFPTITPGGGVAGMPADFPSDVPLMKDAQVEMVHEMPQNARNVLVRTSEDQKQLYEFYQKDLKDKGWVLEQYYEAKQQAFLGFRKGKTVLNMVFSSDPKDPSKRLVSFIYQEEQPLPFKEF
jgi:hypothetical protein